MARSRDSRTTRQSWSKNPLISGNSGALVQAVAPFLDWAKLQKNVITKFNDKGRPDHVTEWVDFQCIITPNGDCTRHVGAGGDSSEAKFTVQWLPPTELPLGSILIHDTFGMMKIDSYTNLVTVGLCSAEAIKLSVGVTVEDGKAIREEYRDIF